MGGGERGQGRGEQGRGDGRAGVLNKGQGQGVN